MSHTSFLDHGWIAIHDGDVILREIKENSDASRSVVKEVTVPASVLFGFVAGAVRHQKTVQIGEASDNEILGIK